MAPLRIATWNIGLRGLEKMCSGDGGTSAPDVHGIARRSGLGSIDNLLDALDADNDTVPDDCDQCPGDDFLDTDNDSAAAGCDICPGGDDLSDADVQTVCEAVTAAVNAVRG